MSSGERITLTLPGERRFVGVVRLFVGGLAARLDLGYETMDDLQLALETVLRMSPPDEQVTLDVQLNDRAVSILVGPFSQDPLRTEDSQGDAIELDRVLGALVAGVESVTEDDGCWLRLDVGIRAGSGSA
jgi:hypothetical protein